MGPAGKMRQLHAIFARALGGLAALAALGGCQAASPADVRAAVERGPIRIEESPSPPLGTRLAWYLPNRLLDLADLVGIDVRLGPQAGFRVVLTRLLAYGYTGSERGYAAGFHGREAGVFRTDIAGESVLCWRHRADL